MWSAQFVQGGVAGGGGYILRGKSSPIRSISDWFISLTEHGIASVGMDKEGREEDSRLCHLDLGDL